MTTIKDLNQRINSRTFVLAATLLFLLSLATPVAAEDIEVNDSCSLANAISAANTDTATGGCLAGSGADTIILTADVDLGAALPPITSNITIEGAGRTIDGKNEHRIFRINSGTVNINDLTLRNGLADDLGTAEIFGGAIFHRDGTLTVRNSRFQDNVAPGDPRGCLSSIGGAIMSLSDDPLNIYDSVFSGNRAMAGAAVLGSTKAKLTIQRSSFTGQQQPPNVEQDCVGTGTAAVRTQMEGSVIHNATFSGNSVAGIRLTKGSTTISHSTIVNNRSTSVFVAGGVDQFDPDDVRATRAMLFNNIIANNHPVDCDGSQDDSVWIPTSVNNLSGTKMVGDDEVADCRATFTGNPGLAPFRSPPGRPGYHPLRHDSQALDAAPDDPNCADTDIRGVARPVGNFCDLGSYEGSLPPPSDSAAAGAGGAGGAGRAGRPVVHTGEQLLTAGLRLWAQYGLRSGIQFERRGPAAVGIQSLIDRGVLDVVDVWGYAEQDWELCFPQAGTLVFLDAARSPRAPESVSGYSEEGYTCIAEKRAGMVVLLSGSPPPPAPSLSGGAPVVTADGLIVDDPTTAVALANCHVGSFHVLNLRERPAGRILGWFHGDMTRALARTPNWFQIEYNGLVGWVSGHYAIVSSDCG